MALPRKDKHRGWLQHDWACLGHSRNTQDLGGDCQPCGPSPEGDSPTGEDPEQKLPWYILQKGAGDSQVVARGELTAEMDLTVVRMAHGASHGGRGQNPGQADPPLLHLRRGGL